MKLGDTYVKLAAVTFSHLEWKACPLSSHDVHVCAISHVHLWGAPALYVESNKL